MGTDSGGRLLMSTYGWPARLERLERDTWLPGYMVRLDLDTRVWDTIASYDGMLGVVKDDMDIESVVVYELVSR